MQATLTRLTTVASRYTNTGLGGRLGEEELGIAKSIGQIDIEVNIYIERGCCLAVDFENWSKSKDTNNHDQESFRLQIY